VNLYLIRHTKVNFPKALCYGQTDVDVTDSFEEEALGVKSQIQGVHFDEVWSSTLQRCAKLADYLFSNQSIQYDARLKELNFGDWEGKAWADIYDDSYGEQWMNDYVNLRCLNGESFLDQINRVAAFFDEKRGAFKGKNIAIVAHGGTIRSFYCHLKNMKPEDAFKTAFDYGSINKLTLND
jgi:alpha-ribazole phosphatase